MPVVRWLPWFAGLRVAPLMAMCCLAIAMGLGACSKPPPDATPKDDAAPLPIRVPVVDFGEDEPTAQPGIQIRVEVFHLPRLRVRCDACDAGRCCLEESHHRTLVNGVERTFADLRDGVEATFADLRARVAARANPHAEVGRLEWLPRTVIVRMDEGCAFEWFERIAEAAASVIRDCPCIAVEAVARDSRKPVLVWLRTPPDCMGIGRLHMIAGMTGPGPDAHVWRYFGSETIPDGEVSDSQLRASLQRELADPDVREPRLVLDISPRVAMKEVVHLIDIARSAGFKGEISFVWPSRPIR